MVGGVDDADGLTDVDCGRLPALTLMVLPTTTPVEIVAATSNVSTVLGGTATRNDAVSM
jgi:hypothetical protein